MLRFRCHPEGQSTALLDPLLYGSKCKNGKEECTNPEGDENLISEELAFLCAGSISVSTFPLENSEKQQGQEQRDDGCG